MTKIVSAIVSIVWPIAILLMSYGASPDYFGPMFKEPVTIVLLVLSVIWLLIGGFLMLFVDGWKRGLVFIFFPAAVSVFYMLAPSFITIATALGPIMQSQ